MIGSDLFVLIATDKEFISFDISESKNMPFAEFKSIIDFLIDNSESIYYLYHLVKLSYQCYPDMYDCNPKLFDRLKHAEYFK